MTGWLQLTDDQKRAALAQAAAASGIQAKVIEKDWWVTLTLKALFASEHTQHLVFKGGTSLSKCWKLIDRFSEDIDIALNPSAFGMEYHDRPTRTYVKQMKRQGCLFTTNTLRQSVEKGIHGLGVSAEDVKVYAARIQEDLPDTDPQTVFVGYKSLYPPISYIADEVKIEVSVRSLLEPASEVFVQSLLNEFFPNPAYDEASFQVKAADAHKTFLEKIFLMHEEFQKPDRSRIRSERMSRHLYDLISIMDNEATAKALINYSLYEQIVNHRKYYTGYSYLNYETLAHSMIDFTVPTDLLDAYRSDYATMRNEMIYGDAPTFEELISRLKVLIGRVRAMNFPT